MRHLAWDGCVNVRDLGGLAIEGGGRTQAGIVVRADDVATLSESGWRQLDAYGVRTVIDLRFPEERSPHPAHASPVRVVEIPLYGRIDRDASKRVERMVEEAEDASAAISLMYVDALETHRDRIVAAVEAVVTATETGAVVVHCAIGKDRTGIVSALLLRLVGVALDDVADDYALSHDRVEPLVERWVSLAEGPRQLEFRRRLCAAPRDGMVRTLEVLEERHGGAERYLVSAGISGARLGHLRERLAGAA